VLVKSEGKRLLEISKLELEDNIKIDLTEVGWEDVDWLGASGGLL
jgi:hypothetical protein